MSFDRVFPWIMGARHSLKVYSEEAETSRGQSRILNARKGEEQVASADSPFPVLFYSNIYLS